jgi:hypothetical protein
VSKRDASDARTIAGRKIATTFIFLPVPVGTPVSGSNPTAVTRSQRAGVRVVGLPLVNGLSWEFVSPK